MAIETNEIIEEQTLETIHRWWVSRPVNQDVIEWYVTRYRVVNGEVERHWYLDPDGGWQEYLPMNHIQPAIRFNGAFITIVGQLNDEFFPESAAQTLTEMFHEFFNRIMNAQEGAPE